MSTATLNAKDVLRACVSLPRTGVWHAEVETTESAIAGAVTLAIAGLTLKGTVIGSTSYGGRTWYMIAGGAGKWRNAIAAKAYRGEIGIKLATVVTDAAADCGETLGTLPDVTLGSAFVRTQAPAARVLDLASPESWYVDELGVTQIGVRPAKAFAGKYELLEKRLDVKRITIAAEDLTGLVPGATLEGIEAGSIRHELGPNGIRSHIYATSGRTSGSRLFQLIRRIVEMLTHPHLYHRVCEYQVVGVVAGYLDLEPTIPALGLPALTNVREYVGIPGGRGNPQNGSTVLVGWVNGDPTRPYVHSYDGEAATGFLPTEAGIYAPTVKLGDASAVFLAKAAEVQAALDALKALAYDANDSAKYSPNPGWTLVSEIRTAMSTLWTALGAAAPTNLTYTAIATTKAKGK